ncbi:hypothetical protein [Niameybacter massiliensis]|uniref:hypothetical protein n=1 Tax=Niameybacter massiliensis TaxID=1658108 RepID=UPI0006B5D0BC|nr:hypothetical protein [Niameybacter massiliensis]
MSQYRNMDYQNNNSCCNCNRNTCCENRCNCGCECPCHRPCPGPMPPCPYPVPYMPLTAQLIGSVPQPAIVAGITPIYVTFASGSGDINLPIRNPLIAFIPGTNTITFNKAGSYLITYQVVANFTGVPSAVTYGTPPKTGNYTIQLYQNGNAANGSATSLTLRGPVAAGTSSSQPATPAFPAVGTQIPITRTTLVNVAAGDTIRVGSLLTPADTSFTLNLVNVTIIINQA